MSLTTRLFPTLSITGQNNTYTFTTTPDNRIIITYNSANVQGASGGTAPVTVCQLRPKTPHALLVDAFYFIVSTFVLAKSEFGFPRPVGWSAAANTTNPIYRITMPSSIADATSGGAVSPNPVDLRVASDAHTHSLALRSSSAAATLALGCPSVVTPTGTIAPPRLCEMQVRDVTWIQNGEIPAPFHASGVWSYEGLDATAGMSISASSNGTSINIIADSELTIRPNQILLSLVQKANSATSSTSFAFMPFAASLCLEHAASVDLETVVSQAWTASVNTVVGVRTSYAGGAMACTAAKVTTVSGSSTSATFSIGTPSSVVDTTATASIIDEWAAINGCSISSTTKNNVKAVCFGNISYAGSSSRGVPSAKVISFVHRGASSVVLPAGSTVLTVRWVSPGSWVVRNETSGLFDAAWTASEKEQGLDLTPSSGSYLYNMSNGFQAAPLSSATRLAAASREASCKIVTFARPTFPSAYASDVSVRVDSDASTGDNILTYKGPPNVSARLAIKTRASAAMEQVGSSVGVAFGSEWVASAAAGMIVAVSGGGFIVSALRDTVFDPTVALPLFTIEQQSDSPARPMVVAMLVERLAPMNGASVDVAFGDTGGSSISSASGMFSSSNSTILFRELCADLAAAPSARRRISCTVDGGSFARFTVRAGTEIMRLVHISPPEWAMWRADAPAQEELDAADRIGPVLRSAAAADVAIRSVYHAPVAEPSSLTVLSDMLDETAVASCAIHMFASDASLLQTAAVPPSAIASASSNDVYTSPLRSAPSAARKSVQVDHLSMITSASCKSSISTIVFSAAATVSISSSGVAPFSSVASNQFIRSIGLASGSGASASEYVASATTASTSLSATGDQTGVLAVSTTASAFSSILQLRCAAMAAQTSAAVQIRRAVYVLAHGAALTVATAGSHATILAAYNCTSDAVIAASSTSSISVPANALVRVLLSSRGRASASLMDVSISASAAASFSVGTQLASVYSYHSLPSNIRAAACWQASLVLPNAYLQEGPFGNVVIASAGAVGSSTSIAPNDVFLTLHLHAPIPAGSVSGVSVRGVVRALSSDDFPVQMNINDASWISPGDADWSSAGAFAEPDGAPGAIRSISFRYAGVSSLNWSDFRAKYILSIDYLSPPDAFIATADDAPVAFVSPSSVPETIYTPTPDPSLPTQALLPIFAARASDRQTVFGISVESSVIPTSTITPSASSTITISPRISRIPNVQVQSAEVASTVSIKPASSVASAGFSVKRCGQ
jgi:hypothetical protein